jgi:proliferating cell nuclear antigen
VEQPPIEEFEFKTKIKINSEDLDIAIKDSKAITDSLIFNCPDTNSFVFEADGETSSYKLPIKPLEYHISEPLKSKYPLLYLEKIIKAKKEFDTVILNFNKDYPCKFEFIKNGIVLSFILAPRVTEE